MQTSFPIVRGIGIGKVLKLDDLMVSDLYTCGTYHDESESMMFSLDKAKQQLKMLHMKSLNRSDDSFAEVVEIMASLLEDENIVDEPAKEAEELADESLEKLTPDMGESE